MTGTFWDGGAAPIEATIVTGLENDMYFRWKQWRKTKHDHNPVNDAMGNAEVLLKLRDDYNLNIKLK